MTPRTLAAVPDAPAPRAPRAPWKAVAVPSEHGGWGLTLEPAVLGLLVAPSVAGLALAGAALVAFLARTPLKVVLVDRWRHRRLDRTVLAARIAAAELALLAALLAVAALTASGPAFWVPLVLAAPVLAVELWFDMRSRSRRLAPEIAGTIGIGAVAAAIALAGGEGALLAVGLWLVVAARAVASIPFARCQLARARQPARSVRGSDAAQAAGVALAGLAVVLDGRLAFGLVAVAGLAAAQVLAARRAPPPAKVLGVQQTALGAVVVLITALGAAIL